MKKKQTQSSLSLKKKSNSISPFKISSPKMRRSSNTSQDKIFVTQYYEPVSTNKKIKEIEIKSQNLYGNGDGTIAELIILPKSSFQSGSGGGVGKKKCNLLSNQCYIDCINYIPKHIDEYKNNPEKLMDDIFTMMEPRLNKDIYLQNINVANLYNNMIDYAAQKWTDEDLKSIKSIIKTSKTDIHYKPVKLFLKEVKFYKYYK